jgi:hypothetical protein
VTIDVVYRKILREGVSMVGRKYECEKNRPEVAIPRMIGTMM